MPPLELNEYCVYTIADGKKLKRIAREGGAGTLQEKKRWVTAARLWNKTLKKTAMPILFADAADCSELVYWGLLTEINLADSGTTYAVNQLRPFTRKHAPQELTLRAQRRKIAPKFIKPYAICLTPSFIK